VSTVGEIGRSLKARAETKPGSFFWVLDPVLGDNGKLYVPPDEVPMYKQLLHSASLILPNQFEAEVLSGVRIDSLPAIARAAATLHDTYGLPHLLITSLRLSPTTSAPLPPSTPSDTLTVIGSTATAARAPRLWRIDVPALPIFFSGTGDMFAALTVARLREQVAATPGLLDTADWVSPDDVPATELPLARAAERVLASMAAVLAETAAHVRGVEAAGQLEVKPEGGMDGEARDKAAHLRRTRAAEVRVVRNLEALRNPPDVDRFRAREVVVEEALVPN
jgi:pyridoxine kinase